MLVNTSQCDRRADHAADSESVLVPTRIRLGPSEVSPHPSRSCRNGALVLSSSEEVHIGLKSPRVVSWGREMAETPNDVVDLEH